MTLGMESNPFPGAVVQFADPASRNNKPKVRRKSMLKNTYHPKLEITAPREEEYWDFIPLIDEFQSRANMSARLADEIQESDRNLKKNMFSATDIQQVEAKTDNDPLESVVEFTRSFIDVPYNLFTQRLKPELWAMNLPNCRGGDMRLVHDYEECLDLTTADEFRERRQIERMALGTLDLEPHRGVILKKLAGILMRAEELTPLKSDMTKTEIIRMKDHISKIYWRVYHSDDETVIADIGSLEFREHDTGTVVTFHSAHVLSMSKYLGSEIMTKAIGDYFQMTLRNYREIVFNN